MSFVKNTVKNIGKNISKSLSGKYSLDMLAAHQKLLDHAEQSATDTLKTSSNSHSKNSRSNWWFDSKVTKVSKIHNKII